MVFRVVIVVADVICGSLNVSGHFDVASISTNK